MPAHKKNDFLDTAEGLEFIRALKEMVMNKAYLTNDTYSANTVLHPDHSISFVNKHMDYIRNHPATDPNHYLANLRLMTRLR